MVRAQAQPALLGQSTIGRGHNHVAHAALIAVDGSQRVVELLVPQHPSRDSWPQRSLDARHANACCCNKHTELLPVRSEALLLRRRAEHKPAHFIRPQFPANAAADIVPMHKTGGNNTSDVPQVAGTIVVTALTAF